MNSIKARRSPKLTHLHELITLNMHFKWNINSKESTLNKAL